MIEKVNLRQMLTIVAIGLVVCFVFSWFGSTKSETVRDNGSGTIRVGTGLKQANDDQRIVEERVSNAATRVERIAGSVADSQGRIGNATTRVGNIESLVIEAEQIAQTDGRILQAIKERAKTGDSSQGK